MSSEAIPAAPVESQDNTALQAVREELRNLQTQRRAFRQRLMRFQRSQKYITKHLPEHSKESSEEAKTTCVKQAYQLLRAFCFSYNFINLDKDAEKFVIPADFESEVREVLTEEYYSKFAAAIKSTKEDFQKELPDSISSDVCDRLLKFVSVKEKDHIVSRYETNLTELSDKITAKVKERDEISPPVKRDQSERREKPKKPQKRQRRNSGSSQETALEDRLSEILKEVGKRSDSVRFSKDDFESFSEAQTQLDALLRETVTEILKMKQSLRKRFARAQTSRRRSNSSSRRRNDKN